MELEKVVIVILGYILTILISTLVVRLSTGFLHKSKEKKRKKSFFDVGFFVGLFEDVIIITFVLLNQFMALALVFTAKTIVRASDIKEKPEYYLVGTLANFSTALLCALLIKFLID